MDTTQDQQVKVRLSLISPGRNPRHYFGAAEMAELESSIRAQGVLMPILLRPMVEQGRYQIVAGERRFRAALAAFGPDWEIPAQIKDMTDAAADAAAASENINRANMTPVEEAEAAAQVLGNCLGDRDEAANRLGWSRGTLDRRLSLMHASEKVRGALQEGKIMLGHAELLAVMRKDAQDTTLDLLLGQIVQMTVAELKAQIDHAALVLDKAIFNKDECASCVHNSCNQPALFAEVISDGRCTNKACFERKTEAELEARATALREDYQVVRIARPGENHTLIMLAAEGAKGVGPEQARACRVCKNFGAVVSGIPDKLGVTYKNVCMDVPCNTQMVTKRIEAEKQAHAAAQPGPGDAVSNSGHGTPAKGAQAAGTNAKPGAVSKVTPGTAPTYPEPSNRIKEYREKLWRAIFKRVVGRLSIPDNRMVLLALCMTSPGKINASAIGKDLSDTINLNTLEGPGSALKKLRELDQSKLAAALQTIAANVSDGPMGLDIKEVVSMLKTFDAKLSEHWKVSADFFQLLTKNEIDAVCAEIGITKAMGDEYAKARNQGKDDYINAILSVANFDYRGRIPKLVTW
jgi:ParB family chromosome partitioning protein